MKRMAKWLLSAAALAALASAATPASAQRYGYGDDGPPPFRRGPGWDGPPRGPWGWHHHRHWRDEGFDRRGWRDGDRREGRFGDEGRDRGFGNDRRFGGEDARRDRRDGDAPRRGGPDRNDRRPFGGDGN